MKINLNPSTSKIVVWLIIAIIVLVVINWEIKTIAKTQAAKDAKAIRDDLKSENLSFDLTQYTILADKLEQSIGPWNTSESAVYSVFDKMQNSDDVKQLVKSFGLRQFTFLIGKLTLPQYMAEGMDATEIEKINESLASKGINMNF